MAPTTNVPPSEPVTASPTALESPFTAVTKTSAGAEMRRLSISPPTPSLALAGSRKVMTSEPVPIKVTVKVEKEVEGGVKTPSDTPFTKNSTRLLAAAVPFRCARSKFSVYSRPTSVVRLLL